MSTYDEGPSPSVAEVTDRRPRVNPIPVHVINSLETKPARYARMRTFTLSTTPIQVIDFDPRYRRVWTSCATNGVWIGTVSQLKANSPDGFILNPGGTAIPWEGFDEEALFAMAVTGTATLSLRFEFWAD